MKNLENKDLTILVVDDNSENLGVANAFLKDEGYNVAVASNGIVALKRIERVKPDLVLLDINMPEMDGFEVCEILKKNVDTCEIPVLFMTASDDIASITRGFKVGAVDYIIKPVKKAELLARVLTQIENYIYKNKMEEEVGNRTKELEDSKEELLRLRNFLANIINSMPSVLVGVDNEFNVTEWNKTVAQTTGISFDEAKGKPIIDVFPQMASEIDKISESITKREIKLIQKKPRQSKDRTIYEDIIIYPLITNCIDGAVIRIDDVTEKVRMDEMMIQTEKMMSIGGLAAGMAHEVNNPLTGIMSAVKLMKIKFSASSPKNIQFAEDLGISLDSIEKYLEIHNVDKMLKTILDSSERVLKVIKNMLRFSRKSDSVFESQNICSLLNETVDLARNDFDFRYIEIVREYEENIPDFFCEEGEIKQVFLNIFKNGAQAMKEKYDESSEDTGESAKFFLRIHKHEGNIQIEIEDNGPGIPDNILRCIFEPFFTTKEKGVGTGLGLSVSYFIITEIHKGTLSAESTVGKGTKFTIELPLKHDMKLEAKI